MLTRILSGLLLALTLVGYVGAQTVLRQSTSRVVRICGVVAVGDGFTPVTTLTLSGADEAEALRDNTATLDISGATWAAVTGADGCYSLTLDTTATNTVGELVIAINDDSLVVPIFRTYRVVEEAVFDRDYAASAVGYVANAPVNVAQFGGSNGTFSSGRPEVNTSHWGGTAAASATVNANATQISGDSGAADALETAFDGTAGAVSPLGIARQGTAQSATGTTLVLDASAPFGDDTAIGMTLVACGSTQGYCQSRTITDYVNSTDTATVDTWTVTPSGTITYYLFSTAPGSGGGALTAADVWAYGTRSLTILDEDSTTIDLNATYVGGVSVFDEDLTTIDINATPVGAAASVTGAVGSVTSGVTVTTNNDKTGYALSAVGVDAIWDELTSGHATSGSYGVAITDILTDTGTTLQGELDGIQDDTEDLQAQIGADGAGLTALPWNAAWDTEVQSEVQDAIEANHLDHLLATTYDPASKPGAADALLNELVESDAGVSRFTANALEQAPTGSGASAEAIAQEVAVTLFDYDTGETESSAVAGSVVYEIVQNAGGSGNVTTIEGVDATDALDARIAAGLATYDPPTNTEMEARTLAAANYATASAVTALSDGLEQTALGDAAIVNCTTNTANFAGSTTTVACILTTRAGGAITAATNDLTGKEFLVLSGDQIYEARFINATTWDGVNSELRLTLSRALPATLADAVTAIIR